MRIYLYREVYFKDLVHVTVEAASRDGGAEVKPTQLIDSAELDSPPAPAGRDVFPSIPRRLRDSIITHFWPGDNLCFEFSLLQPIFCGSVYSSASNIIGGHTGPGSCGEMTNPEGKSYL